MRNKILYILGFIALFANFLANDKPILCSFNGTLHAPIVRSIGQWIGISAPSPELEKINIENAWKSHPFDWKINAPIPYGPAEMDRKNKGKSPFDTQEVSSLRYRHWLGTDYEGHDVFAGLISGTRIAFLVCLMVLGIAGILGIFLGLIAGYYGDTGLKIGYFTLILSISSLLVGLYLASVFFNKYDSGVFASLIFIVGLLLFTFLGTVLDTFFTKIRIALPLDLLLMRSADVFNAVPALIVIGVALSLPKEQPSIWVLMALIGFFSWTGFALFIRGEMLRIRALPYMEAAKLMRLPDWKIMIHHALPNAIRPAIIALSMGVGSAILLEASLSYLGLSNDVDTISWGRLLLDAKSYPTAWWLTLFPGFMIFITVSIFYSYAFDEKMKAK